MGPQPRPGLRSGRPPVAAPEVCAGRGHSLISMQGSPGSGGRRGRWSGLQGTVSLGQPLAPSPAEQSALFREGLRTWGHRRWPWGSTRAVLAPAGPSVFLTPMPPGVGGAVSSERTLNALFAPAPLRLLASTHPRSLLCPFCRAGTCPQPLSSKGTSPGTPCLRPWAAPFVWTHLPPDMTLLLLRVWLCRGGDTDCPQRPVTCGVHAGDPHSPVMMRFRGMQCGTPVGRSPRARGSLPTSSPEGTCAPSLEFPPLHWCLCLRPLSSERPLTSSSSSSSESLVSAPVLSHI